MLHLELTRPSLAPLVFINNNFFARLAVKRNALQAFASWPSPSRLNAPVSVWA